MSVVLPNNLLAMHLPQPGIMVRARRDQVRRVSTECAIPYPALVAYQRSLEGKRFGFFGEFGLRGGIVDFPDLGAVICATGCEFLDVGREQDAGDVFFVSDEVCDGEDLGLVVDLLHFPDKDVALSPPRCVSFHSRLFHFHTDRQTHSLRLEGCCCGQKHQNQNQNQRQKQTNSG